MKKSKPEGRVEPAACDYCATIPISYLAHDVSAPIVGWDAFFANRGVEVARDDLGRPAEPGSTTTAVELMMAYDKERER